MSTEANKNVSTEAAVTAASEITTSPISQTLMGIAIVWFVGACALGISGVLLVSPRILFLFVVIPVIIFGAVFAFSPRLRVWALALDSRLIILLNMLRAGGLAFLMLYTDGRLNGAFALPAGWMDFIVAFTAPLAAFYLTRHGLRYVGFSCLSGLSSASPISPLSFLWVSWPAARIQPA